jgi:hypothetical protein
MWGQVSNVSVPNDLTPAQLRQSKVQEVLGTLVLDGDSQADGQSDVSAPVRGQTDWREERIIKVVLRLSLFIMLAVVASACSRSPAAPSNPDWLNALKVQFQSQPVTNPPRAIYGYSYHGETVYYVAPVAADQYSTLYDASGHVICAPDGGITGGGDGRCPDFLQSRTDERLIWRDPR